MLICVLEKVFGTDLSVKYYHQPSIVNQSLNQSMNHSANFSIITNHSNKLNQLIIMFTAYK